MIAPLVSIIIPVYNAEAYLAQTIQSALDQTWPNKEILMINDGSTDNSLAIIRQFDSDIIKIYSQENQGASVARNYGLKQAQGEYIQFLDADDLLSPDKIKAQTEVLMDFPGYVGLCGTIHFQDGTDPLSYHLQHEWVSGGSDDPVDFLIKLYGGAMIGPEYGGMVQPNAWLTPKALIDKAGPWNTMRSPDDDGEFFCRVILASKGIKYAHNAVNYYRKFTTLNSWSAQRSHQSCSNILQATKLKAQHLQNRKGDPRLKNVLGRLFWENAYSFYPYYTDLAADAQKNAETLAPHFKFNPYQKGLNHALARAFGWKTVKYLQYLKQKIS
jgi:glycosyltransferase involved in cell wall biosynthesis